LSNALARETSPYLLQHADNPVEWLPWGREAFARAREEEKPILLSIGYSSCHWCHVMAHESFEDPETAARMNEGFVCVKVDREERPDVDQVYMQAVQAMTGGGGWPLTVFLTPEGKPYYGGTYFPPEPRHGMPSFPQVLDAAGNAFRNRRDEVEEASRELVEALGKAMATEEEEEASPGAEEDLELVRHALGTAAAQHDPVHGGFGSAPKFPQASTLDFLLRCHEAAGRLGGGQGEVAPLEIVDRTLGAMARGGIRDHLAGGFHRYSVDARWHVPHFEKMLYDNALLARLYLDAWKATGEEEHRETATSTLEWLLAEMRSPAGGFYAALDADTEGEEGRFYVWSAREVHEALDEERARIFAAFYDVREGGNWEGTNVLRRTGDAEGLARAEGLELDELRTILADARTRLRARREERERPFRDEKVLVAWNALAIRAFAAAGAALERSDFLDAAREAAHFLLDALRRDGVLLHSWKDGEARVEGFLDDWAGLGNALLDLHEATLEPRWLEPVEWIVEGVLQRFWEEGEGVFYDAPSDGEPLVVRPRDPMDNPTPSGSSLAAELLLRASLLTGKEGWAEVAGRALSRSAPSVERYPLAFGAHLSALLFHRVPPVEVALVGTREDEGTAALLATLHRRYLPRRLVVGRSPEEELPLESPLLTGRGAREGRATAYVCRAYACRAPATSAEALARRLEEVAEGGEETEARGAV